MLLLYNNIKIIDNGDSFFIQEGSTKIVLSNANHYMYVSQTYNWLENNVQTYGKVFIDKSNH